MLLIFYESTLPSQYDLQYIVEMWSMYLFNDCKPNLTLKKLQLINYINASLHVRALLCLNKTLIGETH